MSDNAFFPEMQALRKKKKGSVFSEPRSADNFSPVLEELEEDQEKKAKKMRHLILPNDFHEFTSKFSNKKFTGPFQKKGVAENAPVTMLNKSSSLGSLVLLDQVEEDSKNEEEKNKRQLFHHYDIVKDKGEEKTYHKKPSHVDNSESPIREINEINEEEIKDDGRKRLTPRGKNILFNVTNVICDEIDGIDKKNSEKSLVEKEVDEIILEEKEEGILEKSGKKVKSKMQEDRDYMKKIAQTEDCVERFRESIGPSKETIQESDEKEG